MKALTKTKKALLVFIIMLLILVLTTPFFNLGKYLYDTSCDIFDEVMEKDGEGLRLGKSVIFFDNSFGNIYGCYKESAEELAELSEYYGEDSLVFTNIQDYKFKNQHYYLICNEGYCSISTYGGMHDFRIYLTVPEEQLLYEKTDKPEITYLQSYEEFSDEERKIFDKMTREIEK